MSLEIKNLTKRFGKKTIISEFSYHFSEKGLYILRGKSGIGKTTLLRIIAGLDKDYSGEIIEGGIGRISFAFQEYRLFPQLSALENVMIASKDDSDANKNIAMDLLSQLGFSFEEMSLLPSELSGGMKQRVSLARTFMKNAPVILLDEPTKELDAILCRQVCEMIKKIAEDKLVILVTHRDDDISLLDGELIDL
jgi:ABC-type multidrug transport system ATPase subunit